MSLTPISLAGLPLPISAQPAPPSTSGTTAPFANLLESALSGASQSRAQADAAVRDLAIGRTDSMHEVLLQVAQADLSFRLILEIRNRLMDAYQEIMKMQI